MWKIEIITIPLAAQCNSLMHSAECMSWWILEWRAFGGTVINAGLLYFQKHNVGLSESLDETCTPSKDYFHTLTLGCTVAHTVN